MDIFLINPSPQYLATYHVKNLNFFLFGVLLDLMLLIKQFFYHLCEGMATLTPKSNFFSQVYAFAGNFLLDNSTSKEGSVAHSIWYLRVQIWCFCSCWLI